MDLISKIAIKLTCSAVGTDEFGNQYFESNKIRNGVKKRSVIYKGISEPSKIPAPWHLWMHYTSNNLPDSSHRHSWQKIHLPNLTGTKFAHKPTDSKGKRQAVSSDYQPWKPNQN
ncbi:MAG: NADH:ubiquinone oxidoreductase subunit [Lentimonas sp.]|jgi:NADH:ubiquinone oxidoreductase subunit